jgi:ethanolamine transporter EutH
VSEFLVFIKIVAFVVVAALIAGAVTSFIAWQNIFRRIEPMFALRLLVVFVAYAWILYLLPRVA